MDPNRGTDNPEMGKYRAKGKRMLSDSPTSAKRYIKMRKFGAEGKQMLSDSFRGAARSLWLLVVPPLTV